MDRTVLSAIESNRVSPTVETLGNLLELIGDNLVMGLEERETGIDITLNQGNLELSPESRVQRGLAFADLVRCNRRGGNEGLGRTLQVGPLLEALVHNRVNFVVIGSIAGLAHGSSYPTYDLDVACAGSTNDLAVALDQLGLSIGSQELAAQNVFSFDTRFGTLDIVRYVPGVDTYAQLRRDSTRVVLAGMAVQVASLNHLIAMKRAAGRRKDRLMVLEYVELADEIRRREETEKP